jgi:hypothetical protein
MPPIQQIALAATALLLTACTSAPPAETAAKSSPLPPAKGAIVALERSAMEAWKAKDARFWQSFLSDRFVGYGASGRLDKAGAAKEFSGAECTIHSYGMSGEQLTQLDADVALLTYKSSVDGTCAGQKLPAESAAASLFVREGETWRGAFHAEAPIIDPKTYATPAATQQAPTTATLDKDTESLLAAEKAVWEAWKDGDRAKLEALVTSEMSFINIFGTRFLSRADALKDWTSHGCKVQSVSVTNPTATRLSPNVAILRFNGAADGTCFGQKIGPIWGTSVYVQNAGQWKWTFGINLPAH